jgi:translocation and assembly module TamA
LSIPRSKVPFGFLAGAAALAVLAVTSPAASFELFGINFFGGATEEEAEPVIGEPQPYTVDFVVAGGDEIENVLQRASNLWRDRDEPASGAGGLMVKARGDYRRLLAALYEEGRYGGVISIRIGGREAAELPPDAEFPDPVAVEVVVDPGPVFLFGETEIVNRAPPPLDRDDEVEAPEEEGFVTGEVARSGVVLEAERLAVEAWREQGHAKAEAIERRVVAAHPQDILDATLVIDPGRRAAYGPVFVQGTERIDPDFVAYMADLPYGAEYDPDDLERANERLARLGVFRSARLEEAEAIGEDGLLPVSVIVQERLPRRFGIGGSYSTVDGLGFETYWLHRNLFGRAESLRLEARVGGIGDTLDAEEFDYRFSATFTKPGVYTPDTNFVASVVGERQVLEPYTRTGVAAQAGFTHVFTEELQGRIFLTGDHSRYEDDFYGIRDFTTAGVLGGLVFDSRDDPADATEGFFAEVVAEPFYEFEYGNAAARLTTEGRAYFGFGEEDRLVAAGRLKLGSLIGAPISETPPDKLFFAGGGGSVRGYAFRNIGVVRPNGDVTGGRSLIEGSVELRARVTERIGLVGFADAGYVGEESFPDFSEDFRVGVGVGLRYVTGLGPIRFDVAVPLDPREDDPDVAFYVGIGQAF